MLLLRTLWDWGSWDYLPARARRQRVGCVAPQQDNRLSKDGDSYQKERTIRQVVQDKLRFTAQATIFLINKAGRFSTELPSTRARTDLHCSPARKWKITLQIRRARGRQEAAAQAAIVGLDGARRASRNMLQPYINGFAAIAKS